MFAGMHRGIVRPQLWVRANQGWGELCDSHFGHRKAVFLVSDTKLLSSDRAPTDPCLGRAGSLAAPSCLRLNEHYIGTCKNVKMCLCQ